MAADICNDSAVVLFLKPFWAGVRQAVWVKARHMKDTADGSFLYELSRIHRALHVQTLTVVNHVSLGFFHFTRACATVLKGPLSVKVLPASITSRPRAHRLRESMPATSFTSRSTRLPYSTGRLSPGKLSGTRHLCWVRVIYPLYLSPASVKPLHMP